MKKSKKCGSVTVSVLLYMAAAILLIGYFCEAAAGFASRSYAGSIMELAGRSVLSEYDLNLLNDYGFFGMTVEGGDVDKKLKKYINFSFAHQPEKMNLFRLSLKDVKSDQESYKLTDTDIFEKQLTDHMKLYAPTLIIPNDKEKANNQTERKIKNKQIIEALPSNPSSFNDPLPVKLDQSSLGNRTLIDLYIIKYFRHHIGLAKSGPEKSFFRNEIEYILVGKPDDETNRMRVRLSITAMRATVNLLYLASDFEKQREIALAAAALAPAGPAQAALIALINMVWAGIEADNDYKRLIEGDGVPFVKSGADWKTGINAALNSDDVRRMADKSRGSNMGINNQAQTKDMPAKKTSVNSNPGPKYRDYLFLLLCTKKKDVKLARIMDLIQINMKNNHYRDFLLSNCYAGLDFRCKVERKGGYFLFSMDRQGEFNFSHVY